MHICRGIFVAYVINNYNFFKIFKDTTTIKHGSEKGGI